MKYIKQHRKNVENNADDGSLAFEVPEGSLKTLSKPFVILN